MAYFYQEHRPWTVCIAIALFLLFWPAPVAAGAPDNDFNTERAVDYAAHLSATIGERTGGSAGEQKSVAWLASVFTNLGYSVEVQPFIFFRRDEQKVGMNVVAVKEGKSDYGTLYVGAHHDTAFNPFNGPGANDNASGVAVLLEAATVLASEELTPTVVFVAFGVEELGMVGSSRYVQQLSPVEKMMAIGMLNLDCVGIGDKLHVLVRKEDHLDFAQSLPTDADSVRRSVWDASDHLPFAWSDIPAVFFTLRYDDMRSCGPNYHSTNDTIDTLEVDALQRAGTNLLASIRHIGEQAELRPVRYLYLPLVFD